MYESICSYPWNILSSSSVRICHKTYIHNLQFTYTKNQSASVHYKVLYALVYGKWSEKEKSREETYIL